MPRSTRFFAALLMALFFLPTLADAQMTKEQMVANALSAAPPSIASGAKVMDWEGNVLREGTNAWTCMPDEPNSEGNDPMCLDAQWLGWVDAWVNKTEPSITQMGFGYMLQGGAPESNTEPYAEGPTADNEWMSQGVPHIMMLAPDAAWLKGLPTSPDGGGPWVMWRDTPYVHVMIPTPKYPR